MSRAVVNGEMNEWMTNVKNISRARARYQRFTTMSDRRDGNDEKDLDRAARILSDAKSVLVITGAGLSADSGMPTYRGITGLYNRDTEDGIPIELALSGETFRRDPALCWKYIRELELACRDAEPNEGHAVLAEWEKRFERFLVLTQNIDSFHRRAGNEHVIEIHGDVNSLHCTVCDWKETNARTDQDDVPWDMPTCKSCGAVARPPVVLFGEQLRSNDVAQYVREIDKKCYDVVMSVGTTSVFPYIASPFLKQAGRAGPSAFAIEINPDVTSISHAADLHLRMGAADALRALNGRLNSSD